MIRASNLTVRLRDRAILHGIDFFARLGEVTAIVGPNGSGKTTLMRALTGDLPAEGQIEVAGLNPRTAKPWQMAAIRAVLPQATPMAFPFTVLEVVRLGLQAGLDARQPHLALAALARVGLQGYEARFYQELSGGEQQRVQIARVLAQVSRPGGRWLMLDEPVSSLDIGHQLQIMELAADFAAQGGGVIAVMHDLNLTAMFAQSVALLADGRLLGQGAPRHVLTDRALSAAYRCRIRVNKTPESGTWLLPHLAESN
ncbi:heme ABC transporter ATP-binding protein [Falsirhodobacter deserti]|uniref:heme ABC transporter ATP-binding protein n=1 Tax=Falsirhodobacter deserti TaxID=1365611 RepID=UPI000FE2A087|nr:heme ABC transporter ATP-binding protein [Falsirhodobacter deserti]